MKMNNNDNNFKISSDTNSLITSLNSNLSEIGAMAKKSQNQNFDPNNDEFADFNKVMYRNFGDNAIICGYWNIGNVQYSVFQYPHTKGYVVVELHPDYSVDIVEDEDKINSVLNYAGLVVNEDEEDEESETTERLKTLLTIPLLIVLLYPLSELLLWILAHVFPMIWADKFSTAGITDFAVKYLPYAYHPKAGWFTHCAVNLVYFGLLSFALQRCIDDTGVVQEKNKTSLFMVILYDVVAIALATALFIPNIFDILCKISVGIAVIGIIILMLRGR